MQFLFLQGLWQANHSFLACPFAPKFIPVSLQAALQPRVAKCVLWGTGLAGFHIALTHLNATVKLHTSFTWVKMLSFNLRTMDPDYWYASLISCYQVSSPGCFAWQPSPCTYGYRTSENIFFNVGIFVWMPKAGAGGGGTKHCSRSAWCIASGSAWRPRCLPWEAGITTGLLPLPQSRWETGFAGQSPSIWATWDLLGS